MRYSRFFILLFFITALTISGTCQTIQTNGNITQGCAPALSITFSWPVVSPTYYWDFKDGATSNLPSPTNIFTKAGVYNVTLQASPTGPVLDTKVITVFATPVLSVTSTTGCAPVDVTLSAKSVMDATITISNYNWVFGDGNGGSGASKTIIHNYASAGQYDVSLAIQTNFPSCDVTQIFPKAVTLLTAPIASFATSPAYTTTCKDTLDVTFIDASIHSQALTYAWNLGNLAGGNGRFSTLQNPNPAVQRYLSGSYNASLTVSYKGLKGCTTSTSHSIIVGRPPVAIAVVKDSICIYDQGTVNTINPPPGAYSWNIGPNASAPVLNQPSVTISYSAPGWHFVSLTVTTPDGLCSDTRTDSIYVDQVTASISPPGPIITCQSPLTLPYQAITNQGNLSYSWHLYRTAVPYKGINYLYYNDKYPYKVIDTIIKNLSSFNYTYYSHLDTIYYAKNIMETFQTDLTVTSNITGCSTQTSVNIEMWPPNAQFKVDITKGCAPLTVTLTDSSSIDNFNWPGANTITSWKWIFGDGKDTTTTSKTPFQHTYQDTGVYYPRLVITTAQGCTDTSYSIKVQVGTIVTTVGFHSNKTTVCPGEQIQLSVDNPSPLVSGYHFITDNNKVFSCAGDQNVSWSYDDTVGTQDVSLMMDYNGCYTTITKSNYIMVNGPVAKIDYYALCSSPMDYHFTSKSLGATSLVWNFGNGQTSTANSVTHSYIATGDSLITLIASGGVCPNDTAMALVHVRKVKANISLNPHLCFNTQYTFDASGSVDVFADCHSGYTWQFPDISTMRPYTTDQTSALFTFNVNSNHTARLIVKDINGCRDTATANFKVYNITVNPPSVSNTDICIPPNGRPVYFKDNSVGDTTLVSWEWNFGDGTPDTIRFDSPVARTFPHTYFIPPANNSFYDVWWVVTDILGCKTSPPVEAVPHTFITYYKPVSSINPTPSRWTFCLGDSVGFNAPDYTLKNSHLSYEWDLGLGNGLKPGPDTIKPIKYPVGNSTVNLVYTEVSTGCKDSTKATVSVQSYPTALIGMFPADTAGYLCAPQNIDFWQRTSQVPFPTTQLWDYGNGQSRQSNLPDTAAYYYDKNLSPLHISLIEKTSYGCADTARKTIILYRPEGNFTMSRSTICRYDTILFKLIPADTVDVTSWTWSFGDGVTVSNKDSVSHAYNFHPPGGQTVAKLIVYKGTCPNNPPAEQPVTIIQTIADFARLDAMDDSTICFTSGDSYSFLNNSIGYTIPPSLYWNFGDSATSSDINPTHKYKAPGIYNVTLAIANSSAGCKDTIRKKAYVYANPVVAGTGDTVCQGNTLQLHVVNPDSLSIYVWTPSTGLSDDSSVNPIATLQHSASYMLTQITKAGCIDSSKVTGVVIENDLFHNWDTTIVIGDYATLPVYGRPVYSFSWNPTDSLSCLNCNYPKARPAQNTIYTVTVTDVKGCFTQTYYDTVKVLPEAFIKMPTSFTPNNDGNNDILYVKGWGIKDLISYQIFNRWGQQLYSSSDINQGWDGRFRGVIENEDVYVYKVKVHTWLNTEIFKEGYVNLLH
jgi:gliding motility-associated-like protein